MTVILNGEDGVLRLSIARRYYRTRRELGKYSVSGGLPIRPFCPGMEAAGVCGERG